MDGRDLGCLGRIRFWIGRALRPGPMGEDVGHRVVGTPMGLIEVKAVLREAREVNDPEIRRARWITPAAPWSRLADVVEAGPDKFPGDGGAVVLAKEFVVGRRSPARIVEVVGTHLMNRVVLTAAGLTAATTPVHPAKARPDDREEVLATGRNG